jgi:acetyl-CoA synthetase
MPMIPKRPIAMLACARIGAIHSVVFGGFSPEALAGSRIEDCRAKFVSPPMRACAAARRCRSRPMSMSRSRQAKGGISVDRGRAHRRQIAMTEGRDVWYHDEAAKVPADMSAEPMKAEDPLFILYTSGSTGKPKGVLHTTGGYLVYAAMTINTSSTTDGDIYWCTADVGWVTGHSYILYGPLANGATT